MEDRLNREVIASRHILIPVSDPKVERPNRELSVILSPDFNAVGTGGGTMESETYVANGLDVPEVTAEAVDSSEWPERASLGKSKKSKQTSSQIKVSQLLESLGEIDAKRIKLDNDRDEIKRQLATAVANL